MIKVSLEKKSNKVRAQTNSASPRNQAAQSDAQLT